MDWTQQRVLITGGAGGLGLASARYLLQQGARVLLLDNQLDKLQEAAEILEAPEIETYCVDITQEKEVEAVFAQIKSDSSPLTALIQCAGILHDGLLVKAKGQDITHKLSLSQWQRVVDVNLTGSFLCGREAAAIFIEQGRGGVIVNVSSIAQAGNIGQSNYAATKAGVSALVVCWAKELARFNIRVAGIAPGVFATAMTQQMKAEAMQRLERMIPLGQLGHDMHFAQTVAFILENEYVSGRVLEIDGGLRL